MNLFKRRFKRFIVAFLGVLFLTSTNILVACSNSSHTLTLVNNNEEGGNLFGEGTYKTGSTVSISSKANKGYKFVSWDIDGEVIKTSSGSYSFKMPNKDLTIYGDFESKSFNVETLVEGYFEKATITGGGIHYYGEDVTLTAVFNEPGFEISEWVINREVVGRYVNTITFKMPLKKVEVIARVDRQTIIAHYTSNMSGFSGRSTYEEGYEERFYKNHEYGYYYVAAGLADEYINPVTGKHFAPIVVDQVDKDGNIIKHGNEHSYPYFGGAGIEITTGDEDIYFHTTFCDYVSLNITYTTGGYIFFDDPFHFIEFNSKGKFFVGTMCYSRAYAYSGYNFVGWYLNGELLSSEKNLIYEIVEDGILEARYEPNN